MLGKIITPLIIYSAMLGSAASAFAQAQPMAVPAQTMSLAPMSSSTVDTYCLDYNRELPDAGLAFTHVAAGRARVCIDGRCKSLQEAMEAGEIAIRGTGDYSLAFENLTDRNMSVEFDSTTALSEQEEQIQLPEIALPRQYDEGRQLDLWRELGQVGDVVKVSVMKHGDTFDVIGFDSAYAPVLGMRGVAFGDLAKTIAELAGNTRTLRIDTSLEPRRLRALIANVRAQAARKGAYGTARFTDSLAQQMLEPATVIGEVTTEIAADGRQVTANFQLGTASSQVPAEVVVEFTRAKPRPVLEKVVDAVQHGVDKVRAKPSETVLRTAASVRDAVRAEVRALIRTDRTDLPTVWLIVGDAMRGYLIVRIQPSEVSSWTS
jgi:hypothetical protein